MVPCGIFEKSNSAIFFVKKLGSIYMYYVINLGIQRQFFIQLILTLILNKIYKKKKNPPCPKLADDDYSKTRKFVNLFPNVTGLY